jgi:hypothetical protein
MPVAEITYPDLPRTGRYPTKHLVGQGGHYPQAAFHGLIVKTAEAIVPLLMHPLRLVGKDIKETQIAAELLSNFLRLEDQALPGSRLSHDIAAASAPVRPIGLTIVETISCISSLINRRESGLSQFHDRIAAICLTTFNTIVTRYRCFDLALRAAYRASRAALRSVCKASSRLAVSANVRSACASAARFASMASSASRAFLSSFSISRAFLAELRSPATATRAACRSAKPGSPAWARNFSSAVFFAFVAAFRRSTKSGALDRRIYLPSQELIVQ